VFHIVEGGPAATFPIVSVNAFGNRPALVASDVHFDLPIVRIIRNQPLTKGDHFVLATDAVALWLLDGFETRTRILQLLGCKDHPSFTNLVNREREARRMKNDDATAIVLRT